MTDLITASDNLVLTPYGFKKVEELSRSDEILGLRFAGGTEWREARTNALSDVAVGVRIITDKNEITLGEKVRTKILRGERELILRAGKIQQGDLLQIALPDNEARKYVRRDMTKEDLDENFAYLLGVMNNLVASSNGRVAIRIWGYLEELGEFGEELVKRFLEVTDGQPNGQLTLEEGPRYSWLILPFQERALWKWKFASYLEHTGVPTQIRLGSEKNIGAYLSGVLDAGLQFDHLLRSFYLSLPDSKNELRRFLCNYLSLMNVRTVLTKVISSHYPYETQTYLDLGELVRSCNIQFARSLFREAAVSEAGDFVKQTTLFPRVRSKILQMKARGTLSSISSSSFWRPVVEWLPLF